MPDGSVYVLTHAAAESVGKSVEMEFVLPPGSLPPPPHLHPEQVESYEVLEGSFEVMVDGEWRTLGPGERASVPQTTAHTFRNRSGAVVRVRNWHEPAMRFEDYIERNHSLLRGAGIKSKRDPRLFVYLSMAMMEFDDTLRPSRDRERIPMQVLARIGRLLRLGNSR
jgi:mannose-6-phosphate isomerase-like protein (cupin superfamily)